MATKKSTLTLVGVSVVLTLLVGMAAAQDGYETATLGTRILAAPGGGIEIKILVEAANLGGGEVEVGEITFPANSRGGGHMHGSIEIFYVLDGALEHTVNGETTLLEPGMVGIVRPGDEIIHAVPGDEPCRALVIWSPGGEADRIAQYFEARPIEREH